MLLLLLLLGWTVGDDCMGEGPLPSILFWLGELRPDTFMISTEMGCCSSYLGFLRRNTIFCEGTAAPP